MRTKNAEISNPFERENFLKRVFKVIDPVFILQILVDRTLGELSTTVMDNVNKLKLVPNYKLDLLKPIISAITTILIEENNKELDIA